MESPAKEDILGDSIAPGPYMGDEDWQLSKDSADAATAFMMR